MRRKLLLLPALLMALCVEAQDVIVKRNGDEIQAKVSKITDAEIEYKKWTNQNGPSYTMKTDDVFMIKYENGEKDVFEAKSAPAAEPAQQEEPIRLCADNSYNQEALNRYNQYEINYVGTDTTKEASKALWVFGFTKASVIADENVEISFDMGFFKDKASVMSKSLNWEFYSSRLGSTHGGVVRTPALRAIVKNKSSKTIYIDLGNSFVRRGDKTGAFYVPEATTVSNSSGGGIGVGIGAISVGGGTSTSNSTTTYSQRILAIPPKSSLELSPHYLMYDLRKARSLKDNMEPDYHIPGISVINLQGVAEDIHTCFASLNRGECLNYTEEACPFRYANIIAYSFSEQCNTLVQMNAELYIKAIVGVGSKKVEKIEQVLPGMSERLAFPSNFLKSQTGVHPRP